MISSPAVRVDSMKTVLLRIGEMAHLSPNGGQEPLVGSAMHDRTALLADTGAAMVIEEDRISTIGRTEEIAEEFGLGMRLEAKSPMMFDLDGVEVWDIAHRAVVPGFVDAHTHLIWAGDRSNEIRLRQRGSTYRQISESGGGIGKTTRETRELSVTELTAIGANRMETAFRHGTTTMEVKSGYGLTTESELALIRAAGELASRGPQRIHVTWMGAHDTPANHSRESYVEEIMAEQLPAIIDQGIASSCDVFCEDGWFTVDETEQIVKEGMASGLSARLHVDEFADSGGLALAAELSVDTADHAGHSSEDARSAAAEEGVLQGFLPGTPYVLGSDHWPPIKQRIELAQPWSLATDFNPNCRSLSIPFSGSLATHRLGVDPLAALVAVTRNPASTLDVGAGVGTLVEGGPADLNVLSGENIDGWCQTPGTSPCTHTMVSGRMTSHF